MCLGEGGGECEAGESGAGADVGNPDRLLERRGLEAAETVGDMDVDCLRGVSDGRGWGWLVVERDQQDCEPVCGRCVEMVLGCLSEETLGGFVGQSVVGCEGLDRFA